MTAKGAAALDGIDCSIVLDISDVKRLGVLADAGARARRSEARHRPSHRVGRSGRRRSSSPTSPRARRASWSTISRCALGLRDHAGDRAGALRGDAHRHGRLPLQQHDAALSRRSPPSCSRPASIRRRCTFASTRRRRRAACGCSAKCSTRSASTRRTGSSWLSMAAGALEKYGVRQEDLDGIVEHARSIAGTRMALFFRDLGYGKVKVSFRSTGDVDVNAFARQFGGGGHAKASGALIAGSLDDVRERVIAAAREFLADAVGRRRACARHVKLSTWQRRFSAASSEALSRVRHPRTGADVVDERGGARHRDDDDGQGAAHAARSRRATIRRSRARCGRHSRQVEGVTEVHGRRRATRRAFDADAQEPAGRALPVMNQQPAGAAARARADAGRVSEPRQDHRRLERQGRRRQVDRRREPRRRARASRARASV